MPTSIGNISFTYDGSATRVKKSSPGRTTDYIGKLYECTNGSCAKFIFAGDTRVAMKVGGQVSYYHPDHQGSTSVVTDVSGNKMEELAYYPFGGQRQGVGTASVSHTYTGQELDAETGLYNYNARLYDPDLGRFMSADSIVPNPANPQSLNRYSYVLNNPLNYTDPTGHSFLENLFSAPDPLTSYVINSGAKNVIDRLPGAAGDIARGFDAAYRNQVGPGLAIDNGGVLGGLAWLSGGTLSYSYNEGWGAHVSGSWKCFFGSFDWQEHGNNRGISTTQGIGVNFDGFVAGVAGSYNFTQRGKVNYSLMAGYSGSGFYAGTSYNLNSGRFSGNAGVSVGQMLNLTLPTSSAGGRDQTIASYSSSSDAIPVTGIEGGSGLGRESSPVMIVLDVNMTHSTAVVHDFLMNYYGIQPSNVSGNVGLMGPAAFVGTAIGGPVHLSPHAIGEIR